MLVLWFWRKLTMSGSVRRKKSTACRRIKSQFQCRLSRNFWDAQVVGTPPVVGSSENVAECVGYRAMPAGIGRVWWAKWDQYWEAFDMERRRPVCSPRGTRTGINGCYWHTTLIVTLTLITPLSDIQKLVVVVIDIEGEFPRRKIRRYI